MPKRAPTICRARSVISKGNLSHGELKDKNKEEPGNTALSMPKLNELSVQVRDGAYSEGVGNRNERFTSLNKNRSKKIRTDLKLRGLAPQGSAPTASSLAEPKAPMIPH